MNGKNRPSTGEVPALDARASAQGFSARLRGAALFDLIQFECMSRSRKIMRVASAGRSALLYFSGGRIVHASCEGLTGEAVVHEVVAWPEGVFEPHQGASTWPAMETIRDGWESVLLRAAKALDDRRASNVVPLPVAAVEEARQPARLTPATSRRAAGHPAAESELVAVRLSRGGDPIERHGTGSDTFADATAYATQLMNLASELFGLEPFASLELTFAGGKCCLIYREPDGDVVAVKPGRGGSIEALRRTLGLTSD